MRIAVVGGTGAVGRHVVAALKGNGHEAVVVSRSHGADAFTGKGLDEALRGAAAVVDVTSLEVPDALESKRFFGTVTRNLLAAEERAGVHHHVLLSIVGLDRIAGNAHYEGKKLQEALVAASPVPWTIQRATQFHEFAGMVVEWTRNGDTATVPPLRRIVDLAGPQAEDLFDMARRTVAARGEKVRLIPSWRNTIYGPDAAGEVLLPPTGARIAPTSFDDWLGKLAR